MKQQKDNWVKILFSFAAPCKGKMALSVFCAILSVAGGFIPFWAVYEILLAFINQNVSPEWHSDLVSGWSSGLPAAGCLPWNLYDHGAYFSLYHFGRNPA